MTPMSFGRLVTKGMSSGLILAVVTACDRRAPEPEGRAAATPPAASTASEPAAPAEPAPSTPAHEPGRLVWADPPGWTRLPQTSPMRVATYKVPREGGDPADA